MEKWIARINNAANSVESIIFFLAVLVCAAVGALYAYLRFRRLEADLAVQIKAFNSTFFLKDRLFFEKYGKKEELAERDFPAMFRDARFREHLWRKEIKYYEALVRIVETLKQRMFYRAGAAGVVLLVALSIAGFVWLQLTAGPAGN
jgi:hypothetical protein